MLQISTPLCCSPHWAMPQQGAPDFRRPTYTSIYDKYAEPRGYREHILGSAAVMFYQHKDDHRGYELSV